MSASWWCCREKVRRASKPLVTILWAPQISTPNFTPIHPVVVQIFKSGTKQWTDQQTDIAIPKNTPLAWLKLKSFKHFKHFTLKTLSCSFSFNMT